VGKDRSAADFPLIVFMVHILIYYSNEGPLHDAQASSPGACVCLKNTVGLSG
jgi:hypothetical protein